MSMMIHMDVHCVPLNVRLESDITISKGFTYFVMSLLQNKGPIEYNRISFVSTSYHVLSCHEVEIY